MTVPTQVAPKLVWLDLSSSDVAAAGDFYSKLFGWDVAVSDDPQYGGYAMATLGGKDVAGIGPKQAAGMPSAWSIYIGTADAEALGAVVAESGGTVIAPAFDVGPQGRMAVFRDPAGAFISAWEPRAMSGFDAEGPGTLGWAELSSRKLDASVAFYAAVFGWGTHASQMPDGSTYVEFQLNGESIAGGQTMNAMVPAEVPSYWLPYFFAVDVDALYESALSLGAHEMLPPMDFPGGRFAIVGDPESATFGLLRMGPAAG